MSKLEKQNFIVSDEDIREALLDINSHQVQGECPSDAKMDAFINNELSEEENDLMWDHIDKCNDCFIKWSVTSSLQVINPGEQEEEPIEPPPEPIEPPAVTFIIFLIAIVNKIRKNHKVYISLFSLILIFSLWDILKTPDIPKPPRDDQVEIIMNDLYQSALNNNVQLNFTNIKTNNISSLSISGNIKLSKDNQAFLTGIWKGGKQLSANMYKKDMPSFFNDHKDFMEVHWDETEWKPYFWLGKWCILFQSFCDLDQDSSLQKHQKLFEIFYDSFTSLSEDQKNERLEKYLFDDRGIMATLNSGAAKSGKCHNINILIGFIMNLY